MAQPRSPATSSLPISPHRLIGREREQATARDYLLEQAVPLLTLTGPGGVGKTRLALAIAADIAGRFHDGVVWVDFAPVRDSALIPTTMATSLGLTLASDRPIEEELVRHLRPRQTLLLLDNCEHVAVGVADVVAHLLACCPALQVLATSRVQLRLRGEQVFPVEPLPLPDQRASSMASQAGNEAVRLFTERSRALRPEFALTDANVAAVAELCWRLDGLPLAIELAAARSSTHSPNELLAQIADRLWLLSEGPRDLPARQQTIEATIAWSYALLDVAARALFRAASVFVGGFTVETIRDVAGNCASVREVARIIGSLVDQNLLLRTEHRGTSRFTMLETIRAFGLARIIHGGGDRPPIGPTKVGRDDLTRAATGSDRAVGQRARRS